MIQWIEFRGEKCILVNGGAITTPERFENFEISIAHLCEDGIIRQFRKEIGTREDIKILGPYEEVKG